jgi:outer membrane immunogenic protein
MTLTTFIRASAVTIGALAVATQVNAADLYSGGGGLKDAPVYAPAPMWTGFYFGAHAGTDWSSVNVNRTTIADDHGASAILGGGSLASSGDAFGGGQLGYNWQASNFVLGLEVDLGAVGNNSGRNFGVVTSDPLAGTINSVSKITLQEKGGFYGDVSGRLGYAWGPALLYAKGGFAWLDTTFRDSWAIVDVVDNTVTSGSHSSSKTLTGWAFGGGMEYMVGPSWTVKAEYLHFDFTNAEDKLLDNTKLLGGNLNVDSVKLGFNYILNRGYAPIR